MALILMYTCPAIHVCVSGHVPVVPRYRCFNLQNTVSVARQKGRASLFDVFGSAVLSMLSGSCFIRFSPYSNQEQLLGGMALSTPTLEALGQSILQVKEQALPIASINTDQQIATGWYGEIELICIMVYSSYYIGNANYCTAFQDMV